MIYLDNAATTKIDPAVFEKMLPYLTTEYGNPHSQHTFGREAEHAVEHAREQVASLIGADPEQIVFTHSATDANHMTLDIFGRAIVSNMEHSSIQYYDNAALSTSNKPWLMLPDAAQFESLMSVIMVNNETGDVNDIKGIAQACHENGMVLHTDATAAAGSMAVDVKDLGVDFMTISSHKMHGPKGAAALYVVDPDVARDLPYTGTPNVAAIVGFGAACELAKEIQVYHDEGHTTDCIYSMMADDFLMRVAGKIDGVTLNHKWELGHFKKILNLRVDGVDGETLVMMCAKRGLMISTGAACDSHEKHLSHVLSSLGMNTDQIQSSVRISFSRMTTAEDVWGGAGILADCAGILREAGRG